MYYSSNTKVFLNGHFIEAKDAQTGTFSQSLHYGNGVFEGIRSYKTDAGVKIFKAKEHYERLLYSAEKMHIKIDYEVDDLIKKTYDLLKTNNLTNAYIRPLVYAGPNMALLPPEETNLFICAWKWDRYLGEGGLNVVTSPFERPNPKSCFVEAKVTGHYTNSILASTDAKAKGFDEALLLDHHGFVAEAPGANFFFEKNGNIFTPKAGNILPGITRSTIIELAKDLGYKVKEGLYTLKDVYGADSAFFAGTAVEVASIKALDNIKFTKNWKDTIGYELSLIYNQLVLDQYQQPLTVI
ncbi:MAG: branched-chain amino acid transaminase [Cyclobacteriaceae bacterium]|nr:branched-chain amino acid transaminase [Cyclobacteriaceae bacterium]